MDRKSLDESCLVFEFTKVNANAISAILASLDIDPVLSNLPIILTQLKSKVPDQLEEIKKYKKIIIAFSVYTTQFAQIKEKIIAYRKALAGHDYLIIAGGPHPIGSPLSMLLGGCDVVCTGEGEYVIRDIVNSFISNSGFNDLSGIAFLDKAGKLVKTSKGKSVDLDDFPPFSIKHRLIRPMEITRGCAWKCRFCQIRSKGIPVKHRSIAKVLEYVSIIHNYFSTKRTDVRFVSPNALSYGSEDGVTLDLGRVEELLSGIRLIIGHEGRIFFGSFPSEVRPETITPESVRLLSKFTNVKKIIVGGQSGSNKVLELADRGHTVDETERAVELLVGGGFSVDVDIIFGLPGEEDEDVLLTLEHMKKLVELGATIHSHTFMPLVGTPFGASEPGKVNPTYLPMIKQFQGSGNLSGQHTKQEKDALMMADLRKQLKETNTQ